MRKELFAISLVVGIPMLMPIAFADPPNIPAYEGAPDPATHPWLKEQLKQHRYPCPREKSPIRGKEDAPVTITEFLDYQCPACAEQDKTIKKIVHDYPNDVKLVIKNLPVTGDGALSRAKVAQAMANQDKFWQAHDMFLKGANSNEVMKHGDKDKLKEYWGQPGGGDGQVKADIETAKRLGLAKTPSFVIDGIRHGGTMGYGQLKLMVDYEIARKKAIAANKDKVQAKADTQEESSSE